MKFKKVLALAMTASILVSSSFMDISNAATVFANEIEQENTEAVSETETDDTEISNREKAAETDKKTFIEERKESEGEAVKENAIAIDETSTADKIPESMLTDTESESSTEEESVLEETTEEKAPAEGEVSQDALHTGETAVTDVEVTGEEVEASLKKTDKEVSVDLMDLSDGEENSEILNELTVDDEDMVRVLILMDGNSILDSNSDAKAGFITKIKSAVLEQRQNSVVNKIERRVLDGEELEINYQYTWLVNGVATEVPYGLIDEIEEVSGVEDVILQEEYTPCETTESADTYTITDGVMIGREDTWAEGYDGEGMKIAIIDTGLDTDHPSFTDDPALTDDSTTVDTIDSVLSQLNAAKEYDGLTASDVWISNKVAYGFNYVDENLTVNHDNDAQGDHGTHVAGIAAANRIDSTEVVGVAPNAQLYVMKVFGANGGAYTDDLLAAVEDALILGADVINMSLGSPAGFTRDEEAINAIYDKVDDTKTVLAIAAGNSTTAGYGNLWGTNTNLASNPDNGIVSSPATYANATSVASVDNIGAVSNYLECNGFKIAFEDGSNGLNAAMITLAGQTLEFAMVGNAGQTAEDFTSADVAGKVAVVSRGTTSFVDKIAKAEAAGAVACLVYNNVSGTISMDLTDSESTIPAASITMACGEYLAAQHEEGNNSLYISAEQTVIESDTAYMISSFSSWGSTSDLQIEPEITAPGGNIYSTRNNGTYGVMSGTSMASPNLAGSAAIVSQYVQESMDLSASEVHTMVNNLLLSTSVPLIYDENVTFSPRAQGSGLVNTYNAVKTKAYLTVDGSDTPKASIGDDVAKTGAFTYDFHVTNFGDDTLYYSTRTTTQTEDVLYDEDTDEKFMATTPYALNSVTEENSDAMQYVYDYNADDKLNTADARALYLHTKDADAQNDADAFRYLVNSDEVSDTADVQDYLDRLVGKNVLDVQLDKTMLVVEPGKKVDVTVSIQVSENGKAFMDENFENGIYVEGFTYLTALNSGNVDLSLPYLGFYGDWTKAPMLDSGYYYEDEDTAVASETYHTLYTTYGNNLWYPGINPYVDESYIPEYVSMRSNGNGYLDSIFAAYVSLLRNAKAIDITAVNAETNELYYEYNEENIGKTYYVQSYATNVPYTYVPTNPYQFTDAQGNYLPNNTKVDFTIAASLDYTAHESNNASDKWVTSITVDNEAPVIEEESIQFNRNSETGEQTLTLTFTDNVQVAAINFVNESGNVIIAQETVNHVGVGETCTMTFDVTGYGNNFMVIPGDYAGNETVYMLTTEDNDPVVDETMLYGYRINDSNYSDDTLFGWVGIDKETAAVDVMSSEYYLDYALSAAEYVGGFILAVDANKTLVSIDPGYWGDRKEITKYDFNVTEMAFDSENEILYAYDASNLRLIQISLEDGTATPIGTNYSLTDLYAMTVAEGKLYGIGYNGNLYTINTENGSVEETVLTVEGNQSSNYMSLTYDESEDCFYWAYYAYSWKGTSQCLVKIDLAKEGSDRVTEIGTVGGNAQIVGLLTIDSEGFTLNQDAPAEEITLSQTSMNMLTGTTETMEVQPTPWYVHTNDVTWSSSNEAVATVDATGKVTAHELGTAVITVTTPEGVSDACTISVIEPKAELTSFVLATVNQNFDNQWARFSANELSEAEALSGVISQNFYAGEYAADGNIYAYNDSAVFYRINPETYETTQIAVNRSDYYAYDMAFDYATGSMYALVQDVYYATSLAQVDLHTGQFAILGSVSGVDGSAGCGVACADDGTVYIVTETGLYTYNTEFGEMNLIGETGYTANGQYVQSMTFDHDNDGLYWSMVTIAGQVELMYLDVTTGKALSLGGVDGGAQMTCLFAIPENAPEVPYVEVSNIKVAADEITVIAGGTADAGVTIYPFNATNRDLTWSVSDSSVATVEGTSIKGLKPGTTEITGIINDNGTEHIATITVHVVASAEEMYGFALRNLNGTSSYFWGKLDDKEVSEIEALTGILNYQVYSGEYYNGKIYTYGCNLDTYDLVFMVYDAETHVMEKEIYGAYPDVNDLAFDYSTGMMYAVAGAVNTLSDTYLYAVDLETGEMYSLVKTDVRIVCLACSTDGQLYGIDVNGNFVEIDKTTGETTLIGNTGYAVSTYCSMAYDHNTGNIYWAQWYLDIFSNMMQSGLNIIDKATGRADTIGMIGGNGVELTALYTVPDDEIAIPDTGVSRIILKSTKELIQAGSSFTLKAKVVPENSSSVVTFASSNEAVATVTQEGVVTGVAYGEAVITASCEGVVAECIVNVSDETDVMYVFNKNGWETVAALNPLEMTEHVEIAEEIGIGNFTRAAYKDGYFYVINEDGELYRLTADQKDVLEIGTLALTERPEFCEGEVAEVVDIELNTFNNKLYVLLSGGVDYFGSGFLIPFYYIYELNCETAELTLVGEIPEEVAGPGAFTFVSETQIITYDIYVDEIFRVNLGLGDAAVAESICATYTHSIIVEDSMPMTMTYRADYGKIFFALYNYDAWGTGAVTKELYLFDPETSGIEKCGLTAYDEDFIDIFFTDGNFAEGPQVDSNAVEGYSLDELLTEEKEPEAVVEKVEETESTKEIESTEEIENTKETERVEKSESTEEIESTEESER